MGLIDQLTRRDGTRIDWGALGSVSIGVILAAVAQGYALVWTAVFDAIEAPIRALAAWRVTITETLIGTPAATMRTAWAQLESFVQFAGLGGFVVALAGVGLTAYAAATVADALRGDD